jgi:hypothetical protein
MSSLIPGTPYSRRYSDLWSAAHNLRGRDRITYGAAVIQFGRELVDSAIREGAVYPEILTETHTVRIRDLSAMTPDMQLRANCQTLG